MDYIIAFVTALLTFISPCVLPMLPVFVSYFAALPSEDDLENTVTSLDADPNPATDEIAVADEENSEKTTEPATSETVEATPQVKVRIRRKGTWRRTLINASGFALGLMIVLVALGALIGGLGVGLGDFISDYKWVVNIIAGSIVIVMGLAFIGIIKIPFLTGGAHISVKTDNMRFLSALVFGLAYAVSFGPCVATFNSVSIMQGILDAIQYGEIFKAVMMQIIYAGTLGILFIISALLIDYLKGFFDFIKRNYKTINLVSGCILILIGLLMAFGVMEKIFGALS